MLRQQLNNIQSKIKQPPITIINLKHFAKVIEYGKHKKYRFAITEILGPSLSDLAFRLNPPKFGLLTLLKFSYQAIEILQTLHQAGFIHRAVESKNFLIGYTKKSAGTFFLIEFSMCRKFEYNDTTRGCYQQQIMNIQQQQQLNSSLTSTISDFPLNQQQIIKVLSPEQDLIDVMNIVSEYYTGNDAVAELVNQVY
ncbi:MAG: hypothetical protein EZS28_017853 [Streblomastix strix]|uniref:Protein kinase domain-containing protein n=1 Tax=Streblomastix strix TaxID=222440 RepID=A0A5J4VWG1_9EUKA|nr:MAG: hypothetical protein EZS28_017853 [Streblomastix strix]